MPAAVCMQEEQGQADLADDIINITSFAKCGNTLSVSHASADKTDFFHNIVFYVKLNPTRTGSLCLVTIHIVFPPVCKKYFSKI